MNNSNRLSADELVREYGGSYDEVAGFIEDYQDNYNFNDENDDLNDPNRFSVNSEIII